MSEIAKAYTLSLQLRESSRMRVSSELHANGVSMPLAVRTRSQLTDFRACSKTVNEFCKLRFLTNRKLFIPKLKNGSKLFINASMVNNTPKIKGVKVRLLKFTDIASGLGNARTANMVALGAYLASKKLLSLKNILKLLPEAFKNNKKLQVLNEQAIKAGMNLIK